MKLTFIAIIKGGIGPNAWDKEFEYTAANFQDAVNIAQEKSESAGGTVTLVEQSAE